jgi:hypothetical protein
MSNMSKQKGKRGEVEFNQLIDSLLGLLPFEEAALRGLPATDPALMPRADVQGHGADNLRVSGLAIEIKRQEILQVDKWWAQACRQADNLGLVPVLAYRQNRKQWTVCVPAYLLVIGLHGYITLTEEVFSQWFLHWVTPHVR